MLCFSTHTSALHALRFDSYLSYSHTPVAEAVMQGANLLTRSGLGFSVLFKDTSIGPGGARAIAHTPQ